MRHLTVLLLCRWRDLNPHGRYAHMNLNHARMPIPPHLQMLHLACLYIVSNILKNVKIFLEFNCLNLITFYFYHILFQQSFSIVLTPYFHCAAMIERIGSIQETLRSIQIKSERAAAAFSSRYFDGAEPNSSLNRLVK